MLRALARWHAFHLIAGASDGHAKNVSVLLHGNSVRLAPFYDLMAAPSMVEPQRVWFKYKMAMKFAGDYGFRGDLSRRVAIQGRELGIDPEWYVAEVDRMKGNLADVSDGAITDVEEFLRVTAATFAMRSCAASWLRKVL
jgi:serine/threonine-protein kinase HipA